MKSYLAAFILSFFASLILVPLVKRLAARCRIYGTEPGAVVPRWGGLAVYFAFLVPLAGLIFHENNISKLFIADAQLMTGVFTGGAMVLLLGVWDDWRTLSPAKKLVMELAIAAVVYQCGFRIDHVSLPVGETFSLGPVLGFIVTAAWITGIMNALNLSDGIDGLAVGISFFAVITLGIISYMAGNILNTLLCCALAGALLGFSRYNFNPAQIYLGDSGSLFLGYMLAILSIWGSQKATTLVALLTPVIAFGIPILDMMVSIARRYFRGLPVFRRDREHIHHKLRAMGFSQRKAVLILYGFCILLNALALYLYVSKNPSVVLVVLVVGFIIGLKYLGYINVNIVKDRWEEFGKIRRDRRFRFVLREVASGLNGQSVEERLWLLAKGVCERLKFDFVRMEIHSGEGIGDAAFEWSRDPSNSACTSGGARIIVPVVRGLRTVGTLELRKESVAGDDSPFFSATEMLSKELAKVLNR